MPDTPPIQAADGNFYGTTSYGGSGGSGTVYKMTLGGILTVIYNFDPVVGGPSAGAATPTQGSDGSLYIVEAQGGNSACGSLIKISTGGVLKNTYVFDCAGNGRLPVGPLFQGSDGNLYGTASRGGTYFGGLLYKLAANFEFTILYNFGAVTGEGTVPTRVIQATDSKFYGNSSVGGDFTFGTIYNYSLSGGVVDTLFNWSNQVEPAGLTQHTDGLLYGANYDGGTNNLGSVYCLNVGLRPFIALVQYQGRTGSTAQILGQGFTETASVTFNGVPATGFTIVNDTYLTAIVPSGATSGPVVVTTPKGTLKSNKNFRIIH